MKKKRFVGFAVIIFLFISFAFLRLISLSAGSSTPELSPEVEKRITENDIASLTQQLVRIRSDYDEGVAANHNEMAAFLADYLRKLGMEVHVIEPEPNYPTVIGRLKGTERKPKLGFLGHYNTVMPGDLSKWTSNPFSGEIKDGRVYGLGSSDMKMAIAACLVATKAVINSGIKLKGDLVHLYIPGEGAQVHSLPYISKNQPELLNADWYLDTEGGPRILKIASGWTWVKVRVQGVTGHTAGVRGDGKPGRPINAIFKLAKVLAEIENFDTWMSYQKHPLFSRSLYDGKPVVEAGKIEGGYKVNQVPDWAEAQVDIRLLPGQSPDGVIAEMRSLFVRLQKQDPELDVTVEPMTTQWVPLKYWDKLTDDDPFIKAIREVAPAYLGKIPEWAGGSGGGRPDIWETGAKYVSFGLPGGGGNAHSPNEYADITSGVRRAHLFAELLLKMLD
ncbi:MAG: M20/M25/M40 family metallo-hydrolase [Planctomycetes bacterium]|nr:M20/M25/M40 family metallo-hydrolase [Planctomycetota bacterium]